MRVVFDLGATKIRLALSDKPGKLRNFSVAKTPHKFSEGLSVFRHFCDLCRYKNFAAVVGAVAGHLNPLKDKFFNRQRLPLWSGKPFRKSLEKIFKTKVLLENDAVLGGLGEAKYGSGRGYKITAFITISTGVNGVRIVDGQPDPNFIGFEIGKHIISVLGRNHYAWEDFVSGSALQYRTEKNPEDLINPAIWREVERFVAYGLHNVIRFWSPEIIVMGGGIGLSGKIDYKKVSADVKKLMPNYQRLPSIRAGSLGDRCGLFGASVFKLNR